MRRSTVNQRSQMYLLQKIQIIVACGGVGSEDDGNTGVHELSNRHEPASELHVTGWVMNSRNAFFSQNFDIRVAEDDAVRGVGGVFERSDPGEKSGRRDAMAFDTPFDVRFRFGEMQVHPCAAAPAGFRISLRRSLERRIFGVNREVDPDSLFGALMILLKDFDGRIDPFLIDFGSGKIFRRERNGEIGFNGSDRKSVV